MNDDVTQRVETRGRKRLHEQPMTGAERRRASRARAKLAELARIEAEKAERERQRLLLRDCRRALGKRLQVLPKDGYAIWNTLELAGWRDQDKPEALAAIHQIIDEMITSR